MRPLCPTMLLIGGLALFAPTRTAAQQADRGDIQTLRELATAPDEATRDREVVRSFLARRDVRATAADHGIDVDRIVDRISTLDSADAAELADRVRTAEQELVQVGGDTFVITSTTVIIVLLVIILIIVA